MKTALKLISIASLGFLLTACTSQMQKEGGSSAAGVGSKHSHRMPDGSTKVHTHDGDLSKTHTHKLSEMQP